MPASEEGERGALARELAEAVRAAGALALGMFGTPVKTWTKGQGSPVSEVTIAGRLRDMFRSLVPANDLVFRHGINSPTVRLEEMTVAGV